MNPVIAELVRFPRLESSHTGAWAVADPDGRIVASGGDIDRGIFPRSAVKAFQAIPLLVGGGAERAGFTPPELALACASHDGSALHAGTARGMLEKIGLDMRALECGTHWPSSRAAAHALVAAGEQPCALHNNCSGKHAGFLASAVAAGITPGGYVRPDHPILQRVTATLAEITGVRLEAENRGTDGCAIPTFAIPLRALATGFARFGSGRHLPADFALAAATLREAVAAHPLLVGGAEKFDTEIASGLGARAFVKVGAEGVYCGAIPERGLGFALKCDDGAVRAAEAACAALLRGMLGPSPLLDRLAEPKVRNWNGDLVGQLRGCVAFGD